MTLLLEYKENDEVDCFALIKSADVKMTKTQKEYISFSFSDKSGNISANLWDATEQQIDEFLPGKIVKITGKKSKYQGKDQLSIQSIRLSQIGEPQSPEDFMISAPKKASEMEEELENYLFKITNPTWNRITRYLFKVSKERFLHYPAAKMNHHAFNGGLAFHTLSIARLADAVIEQYEGVNESLLLAGALLHDLGKIIELSGPIGTEYTMPGKLLGHIVLIDEQVAIAAKELKIDLFSEDMLLLRHVILAHHGVLEYGSPVVPKVLEAQILHNLDNIDASIEMIKEATEHIDEGTFSPKVFGLNNTEFYKAHKHN